MMEAVLRRVMGSVVGAATGGSNTTLTDTNKDFETDRFKNADIHIYKNGKEYIRTVISNTSDTFTFNALPTGVSVEAGDAYSVVG